MLVFYNSKIAKIITFIGGFKTITLFGMCFTEKDSLTPKTIEHETAHSKQYFDCVNIGLYLDIILFFIIIGNVGPTWNLLYLLLIPLLLFYILYGVEFLIKWIKYKNNIEAYRNISFEKHAKWIEETYNLPCEEQHHYINFGWFKFI